MTINTKSTLARTSFYVFGNPRYNVAMTEGKYIPDKRDRDYMNGTYDMYFPMLQITSSPVPYLSYTSVTANYTLSGVVSTYPVEQKTTYIGETDRPANPKNTSLEKIEITDTTYGYLPCNPGWDVIQDAVLVKLTANYNLTKALHAYNLTNTPISTIYRGTYVNYEGELWFCLKDTISTPSIENDSWLLVPRDNNIFNADIYFLTSNTTTYSHKATDANRYFNPDEETNLVSWNCAYYST